MDTPFPRYYERILSDGIERGPLKCERLAFLDEVWSAGIGGG